MALTVPGNLLAESAPYDIGKRALPKDEAAETLLPIKIGDFTRGEVEGDIQKDDEVYATYKSPQGKIFLTVAVTDSALDAQEGVQTAKEILVETNKNKTFKKAKENLTADPAYFSINEAGIDFVAWSPPVVNGSR